MNRRILSLILLLFLGQTSIALLGQEPVLITRSNNKIVLEGKVYYVHVVKAGHTLYSIAKAYNISEKEISIENPGISEHIRIGQVIKIPDNPSSNFEIHTLLEKKVDGETHLMKEGETFYSISRIYGCTEDELKDANPGLNINNIPIGYLVKIPMKDESTNESSFNEEGVILHKVKRGESTSSIARFYKVSAREIRSMNKELGWGGPRIDDVLRIPQAKTTVSDLFASDLIMIDSSLTEVDTIEKWDDYQFDEISKDNDLFGGRIYNIAYMIPFNYEEMEPLDSLLKDEKSLIRRQRIREDYILEKKTPKAVNFLEFMEGSLLAIDSLTDAGARFNVHYYDTKKSISVTREILERRELKDMDLIIGPFYPYNLDVVNVFSKENRIPLVAPFHSHDSLLFTNPYLFQPIPSYKTEIENNVKYISRAYRENLVFVHNGDSSELEKIEYYKKRLFEELEQYSALETVLFKEVIISEGETDNLMHALKPDMKNLIIMPGSDEAFASQVATKLAYKLEKYDIELFGSTYWLGFHDIEINYIHSLKLIISSTHWYDYTSEEYLSLLKKFRTNYFREPSGMTRQGYNFGIVGYDLSLYFLSALSEYGRRFIVKLDEHHPAETQTDYMFEKIGRKGGFENKELKYYSFDEELEVKEISLPEQAPVHHFLQPAMDDSYYYWENRNTRDSVEVVIDH